MPRTTIDESVTTCPSIGSRIASGPVGAVVWSDAVGAGTFDGDAVERAVTRAVGRAAGEGVGGPVGVGVGAGVGEGVARSVGDAVGGDEGLATGFVATDAIATGEPTAVPDGSAEPTATAGARGASKTPVTARTTASAIPPTRTRISQSLESPRGAARRSSPRGIVPLRCAPGADRGS